MSASSDIPFALDDDRIPGDPPDPASIMLLAVALIGLGVTMIYSASFNLAGAPRSLEFWTAAFWQDTGGLKELKQLVFVPIALALMWLFSHLPYRMWGIRRHWFLSPVILLFLLTLALLVAVLVAPSSIAPKINGAKRWFRLAGGFSLQPSELAKLALVLMLSALLADSRFPGRKFLIGMVPLVLLTGLIVVPVIKEDFGTALLISAVACCLLVCGGTRIWQLLLFIPPAGAAGVAYVMRDATRWARVEQWLAGDEAAGAVQYHIHQSQMAIASGNWWGRGLGDGIQKFYYLPEGTTDFIFANLCEELGTVGGLIVIGVFIMMLWQFRRAMLAARDALGQYIVLGVMLTIGFQAAMNVAVVTGSVPPKGIALPFVSAGGSGLVMMSIMLGIAVNVAQDREARGRR